MKARGICGLFVTTGLLLLATAASDAAIAINLDFDGLGGPTQAGWVGINGNRRYSNGTQLDGVADGLPAGVQAGFGTSTNERNRTPSDANLPGAGATRGFIEGTDYTDLMRDYVSLDGDVSTPSLVVKGLPAGQYRVWVIAGDLDWGGQYQDFDFGVNGVEYNNPGYPSQNSSLGGAVAATIDSINMLGPNPNHPTNWSITTEVLVALNGSEDLNVYRGAAEVADRVRLAGVTITRVPEPATAALLGLGAAGMAALRRRRRAGCTAM